MPSCWVINDRQLKPIMPVDICLAIPHQPHLQGTVPNFKLLPIPAAVTAWALPLVSPYFFDRRHRSC